MYIYLDIVDGFACEMCGACCRSEWSVTVDEPSYQRNAALFARTGRDEEFQQAFVPLQGEKGLGEYAYIAKQGSGACWFLDTANRCRLHKEAGHSHLDKVCKTFPRYPMNTARGIELTLSFSCPSVMTRVSRVAPLAVIRTDRQPAPLYPDNYVIDVYPNQQANFSPLLYYFELEHHFIDVMQCRSMSIEERIVLLTSTVESINGIRRDEAFDRNLSNAIWRNYEFMDSKMPIAQPSYYTPDILLEHFFVNLIFKKLFYMYGLQRGQQLLQNIWRYIDKIRRATIDSVTDVEHTRTAIMAAEFQYSHNRRQLWTRYLK